MTRSRWDDRRARGWSSGRRREGPRRRDAARARGALGRRNELCLVRQPGRAHPRALPGGRRGARQLRQRARDRPLRPRSGQRAGPRAACRRHRLRPRARPAARRPGGGSRRRRAPPLASLRDRSVAAGAGGDGAHLRVRRSRLGALARLAARRGRAVRLRLADPLQRARARTPSQREHGHPDRARHAGRVLLLGRPAALRGRPVLRDGRAADLVHPAGPLLRGARSLARVASDPRVARARRQGGPPARRRRGADGAGRAGARR